MSKNQKWTLGILISFCVSLFLIFFIFLLAKNENLFAYDEFILKFIFERRVRFFDYFFVIFSYLGETKVIAVLCIVLLLPPNRKQVGLPVAILTTTSAIVNLAIKYTVMRARPEGLFLVEPTLGYSMPSGYSFPSGHAQTGTVFYMSFAILQSFYANRRWLQHLLILSGIMISTMMCFARIYIGVHFFSDVICGLCLAIVLLCAGYILHEKLNLYQNTGFQTD